MVDGSRFCCRLSVHLPDITPLSVSFFLAAKRKINIEDVITQKSNLCKFAHDTDTRNSKATNIELS